MEKKTKIYLLLRYSPEGRCTVLKAYINKDDGKKALRRFNRSKETYTGWTEHTCHLITMPLIGRLEPVMTKRTVEKIQRFLFGSKITKDNARPGIETISSPYAVHIQPAHTTGYLGRMPCHCSDGNCRNTEL